MEARLALLAALSLVGLLAMKRAGTTTGIRQTATTITKETVVTISGSMSAVIAMCAATMGRSCAQQEMRADITAASSITGSRQHAY
jgi:hypothetical protein